jgi:uncharacterized protein (TIGR01777 family)
VRVLVSGSTGLIGNALVKSLEGHGHRVTRLVRGDPVGAGHAVWDPARRRIDAERLEGHDAVVNLAGAGIGARRWTKRYKEEIRSSRVVGTDLLARTLATLTSPPKVLASASGINIYGDRGDEELTEQSPAGTGFLAGVVTEWEAATAPASTAGIRVTHLRSGVVFSRKGGALHRPLPPFRLGLGAKVGSGRQYLSWITIDDEVAAIEHILGTPSLSGPVNLVSPEPVTNAEFTRGLGRALNRPAVLAGPPAALKVALGAEMVSELLLASMRVLPAALQESGFSFAHPELGGALAHVLSG